MKNKYLLTDEQIKDIIASYRGKLSNADMKKPLFTLERDVRDAQLIYCEPLIRADAQKEARAIVKEMTKVLKKAQRHIAFWDFPLTCGQIAKALSKGREFLKDLKKGGS